jgi:hypothetical protein
VTSAFKISPELGNGRAAFAARGLGLDPARKFDARLHGDFLPRPLDSSNDEFARDFCRNLLDRKGRIQEHHVKKDVARRF